MSYPQKNCVHSYLIADYIIWYFHEHGDYITNLKLQKLLYYAQAWFLVLFNKPLMSDEFEAWVHGPVIPGVYARFKKYSYRPITEKCAEPQLKPKVKKHLKEVIMAYGHLAGFELENLTHSEPPWREARGKLPMDMPCHNVISNDTMKDFYSKEAEKHEEHSEKD